MTIFDWNEKVLMLYITINIRTAKQEICGNMTMNLFKLLILPNLYVHNAQQKETKSKFSVKEVKKVLTEVKEFHS